MSQVWSASSDDAGGGEFRGDEVVAVLRQLGVSGVASGLNDQLVGAREVVHVDAGGGMGCGDLTRGPRDMALPG